MTNKKEPLKKICFNCQQSIIIKFCPPLQDYVKKNNWGYWTEDEKNQDKYICSPCLRKMYYEDHLTFREQVISKTKRNNLKVYLSLNIL